MEAHNPFQSFLNPFSPPPYPHIRLDTTGNDQDNELKQGVQQEDNVPHATSALDGLTIQQMCDLDVEQLAVKIDKHHCQTKKSILDNMLEVKAKMLAAQSQAVADERRGNGTVIAAKQAEIELLRFELNQMTGRANKMIEVARRLAAAYDATKHRRRETGLFTQAFYCWRQFAIQARQRKMRLARAQEWNTEVHLKRHVLRAWFRTAMQDHRVTVNVRAAQAVEHAKQGLAAQFMGHVEDLRRQLQDTHSQLEQEQEARAKLEENMKQAFMRGVCALNIEAVGIMKRSGQHPQHQPGSTVPPPNPLPPPPYMHSPPARLANPPPLPPHLLPTPAPPSCIPPQLANTQVEHPVASSMPSTPAGATAYPVAHAGVPHPSGLHANTHHGTQVGAPEPDDLPSMPSGMQQAGHWHHQAYSTSSSNLSTRPPTSGGPAPPVLPQHSTAATPRATLQSHLQSAALTDGSGPGQRTSPSTTTPGASSLTGGTEPSQRLRQATVGAAPASQAAKQGSQSPHASPPAAAGTTGIAQNFYRPKVVVERGPAGTAGEPRPRATAPVPSTR